MADLVIFLFLLFLGYFAGTMAEARHYRSIARREETFLPLPTSSFRTVHDPGTVERSFLVDGSAVISVDYFKRLLAGFRAIVGGRVKSYESLIDRARREAVLRMKESAAGADEIVNVRIETSSISKGSSGRNSAVSTVEALAYGTALIRKK